MEKNLEAIFKSISFRLRLNQPKPMISDWFNQLTTAPTIDWYLGNICKSNSSFALHWQSNLRSQGEPLERCAT